MRVYAWILAAGGMGLLGYLSVDTIDRMAIAAPSLLAVESIAGLLFVAVLISAIWQSVSMRRGALASTGDGAAATTASATPDAFQPSPGNIKPVLSSALVLVAFALWLLEADAVMWTLVTLSLIFPAIKLSRIMVDHVFDHVDDQEPAAEGDEDQEESHPSKSPNRYHLYRPIADRLIRFLLVIVAVLTIGFVWDFPSMLQSTSNSLAEKVLGVIIDIVFALLIADFIWTLAKTAIEQKLAAFPTPEPGKRSVRPWRVSSV